MLLQIHPMYAVEPHVFSEKLTYDISYLKGTVGLMTLSYTSKHNGKTVLVYTDEARSLIAYFYKLNNSIETTLKANNYPKHYWQIKKDTNGRYIKNREVSYEKKKITYIDNLKKKVREFPVTGQYYDFLSGLFALRKMKLEAGTKASLPIFQKRTFYTANFDVLRKETIEVPLGKFDTVVVDIELCPEGSSESKVDIRVWFSDDKNHRPVKLEVQFFFGSISSQLREIE